jgi:hypothetical protein
MCPRSASNFAVEVISWFATILSEFRIADAISNALEDSGSSKVSTGTKYLYACFFASLSSESSIVAARAISDLARLFWFAFAKASATAQLT